MTVWKGWSVASVNTHSSMDSVRVWAMATHSHQTMMSTINTKKIILVPVVNVAVRLATVIGHVMDFAHATVRRMRIVVKVVIGKETVSYCEKLINYFSV